ncbi:MAG: hypothetical protein U0234_29235 [Sandaracinus sp.]
MRDWLGPARLLAAIAAILLGSLANPAAAQPSERGSTERAEALASPTAPAPSSGWALDVMAATAVPTVVGAEVRVETPGRFLLDVMAGGNPYGSALGDLVQAYGGGETGRTVVGAIASSAGVLRLQAGLRPAPDAGLEILAGYTLMVSNPSLSRATLEALSGQSFAYAGIESAPLHVLIHAVSAELGWSFVIADHLVLRLALGGSFTVASNARLDVPDAMRSASPVVGRLETDIASAITHYGFVPEARVAVGYRF